MAQEEEVSPSHCACNRKYANTLQADWGAHRYELGRQPSNTKLTSSVKTVRRVRVRGGNFKFRALRLDSGNFSWGSEASRFSTTCSLICIGLPLNASDFIQILQ